MDDQKDLLKYFMERTDQDLKEIKSDLKRLFGFRMMLMGGAAVISALISFIVIMIFGR